MRSIAWGIPSREISMTQPITMCAPVPGLVAMLPSKDIHLTAALSPSETQRQVWRTLRPAFMLHGDPTAAATLQVYARACGMDVAAWHLHHLGGWLSDAEVQRDGVALADSTLAFEATHTDDPIEFCRLYQSAFCAGYRAYQVAIEAESTRGRKIQRQSDQVIITTAGGTVRVARSLYDYLEAVHTDDPNALWDGNFWEQVGALIEGVQIEYAGEVQKVEGAV